MHLLCSPRPVLGPAGHSGSTAISALGCMEACKYRPAHGDFNNYLKVTGTVEPAAFRGLGLACLGRIEAHSLGTGPLSNTIKLPGVSAPRRLPLAVRTSEPVGAVPAQVGGPLSCVVKHEQPTASRFLNTYPQADRLEKGCGCLCTNLSMHVCSMEGRTNGPPLIHCVLRILCTYIGT